MLAIISDIHGNHEALEAVLQDIDEQTAESGLDKLYCLGDIVGYGPNPCECVDAMMEYADLTILGNHDQGALFDPEGFNPVAEAAIFWTRKQLEQDSSPAGHARWEFLGERPRMHEDGDQMFVHGSARDPLNEYVFPDDIYHPRKIERIFQLVKRVCFQGHTHVPGIFGTDGASDSYVFRSPDQLGHSHTLAKDAKALVNVGSVGQPRDGDPRACYVLLDGDEVTYRRVEYDVETVVAKIKAIPDLDDFLGERLRGGQ